MEKVVNAILFGKGKDSLRNKFCLYKTQENNPDWQLKIWTEDDEEVNEILKKNSFLSLKNEYPLTSITYEFIKLSLMLKYGGLWIESDMLLSKIPNFNPNISYLQLWTYEIYHYTFNTWLPIYINRHDEFIKASIIRSLNALKKSPYYFYTENKPKFGAEAAYQVAISVPISTTQNFVENHPGKDVSDILLHYGLAISNNAIIFMNTCKHYASWAMEESLDKTDPNIDTILYCFYKDTGFEKYKCYDISKVDSYIKTEN